MSDLERAYEAAAPLCYDMHPNEIQFIFGVVCEQLGIDPNDLATLRKQHSPEWNHHSRWRWITDWRAVE